MRSTPCLARIQQIADETGLVFLVNQWARLMGKWLYDSSGKRWEVRYYKHAVGFLGVKADDLNEVASYMNDTFGAPVTGDKARLNSRKTLVTPSVEHVLSEYKSLKGMRENYCYLIKPHSSCIYFRRYTCTSCIKCKHLEFLKCVNTSRGKWKKWIIQSK